MRKKSLMTEATISGRFLRENMPIDQESAEKIAAVFQQEFYTRLNLDQIIQMLKSEVARDMRMNRNPDIIMRLFIRYCDKVDMVTVASAVNTGESTMRAEIDSLMVKGKENANKERNITRSQMGFFRRGSDDKRLKLSLGDSELLLSEKGIKISKSNAQMLDRLLVVKKHSFYPKSVRINFIDMIIESFNLKYGDSINDRQVSVIIGVFNGANTVGCSIPEFTKIFIERKSKNMMDLLREMRFDHIVRIYEKRGIKISHNCAKILLDMQDPISTHLNEILSEEAKKHGKTVFVGDHLIFQSLKAKVIMDHYAAKNLSINLRNAMKISESNMNNEELDQMLSRIEKEEPNAYHNTYELNNSITHRLKYYELLRRFNFEPLISNIKDILIELKSLKLINLILLENILNNTMSQPNDKRAYGILFAINYLFLQQEISSLHFALETTHEQLMKKLSLEAITTLKYIYIQHLEDGADEDALIETIEKTLDSLAEDSRGDDIMDMKLV